MHFGSSSLRESCEPWPGERTEGPKPGLGGGGTGKEVA